MILTLTLTLALSLSLALTPTLTLTLTPTLTLQASDASEYGLAFCAMVALGVEAMQELQ